MDAEIVAGVDLAIDGGELGGEPSTVVDVTALDDEGTWEILRQGALSRPELENRLRGTE
jgi:tRNA A37 threonylcarbamoyladenosine synthetase subunit TsaC/SUA5/YrdC